MKSFKQVKVIEELNLARGTESMKASQMRPTSFKDKSKYTRKHKHKNRQDKNLGDYFFDFSIFRSNKCSEFSVCQIKFSEN